MAITLVVEDAGANCARNLQDVYFSVVVDLGLAPKAVCVLVCGELTTVSPGSSFDRHASQVLLGGRPLLCGKLVNNTTGNDSHVLAFIADSSEVEGFFSGETLVEFFRQPKCSTAFSVLVYTADEWIEVHSSASFAGVSTNPSLTIPANGLDIQAIGAMTVQNDVVANVAPNAGTTQVVERQLPSTLNGQNYVGSFVRGSAQGSAADQSLAWTSPSKNRSIAGLGLKEVTAGAPSEVVDSLVGRASVVGDSIDFADLLDANRDAASIALDDVALVHAVNISFGPVAYPTLPEGWELVRQENTGFDIDGYIAGQVVAFRKLTGDETDTSVWTDATEMEVVVYRGVSLPREVYPPIWSSLSNHSAFQVPWNEEATFGSLDLAGAPGIDVENPSGSVVAFFSASSGVGALYHMNASLNTPPEEGAREWGRTLSGGQAAVHLCSGDSFRKETGVLAERALAGSQDFPYGGPTSTISVELYGIEEPGPPFCEEGTDEEPEYLPECEMELSVYEIDGVTKAWTAGTATDHATPYLMPTQNYAAQEVDPVAGAVTIGQVEVSIADVRQTPGDQTTGYVTEKLSDGGIGAIYGRRCRLVLGRGMATPAVIVADGPAGSPRLDASYAGYRWTIRDTRDVERKVRAFTKSSTTVMPLGVLEEFGYRGATNPVPATFKVEQGDAGVTWAYFDLLISEVFYDDLMREAMEAADTGIVEAGTWGQYFPDTTWPGSDPIKFRHYTHPTAIWWRLPADVWHVIENLSESTITGEDGSGEYYPERFEDGVPALVTDPPLIVDLDELGENILRIRVPAYPDASVFGLPGVGGERNAGKDFPEPDDAVEVMLVYAGKPTPKYPLHIDLSSAGQLLCRLYSGYYSPRDPDTDAIVPTGIRWDGGSLAQMTDPVMLRVTEPVDDLRDWAEKYVYAPSGFFPALDSDGRISVLSQVPPDSSAGLPEVNDAAAEPSPDWNGGDRVVNVLSLTYPRFYQPNAPGDSADWIAEREVIIEYDDVASIEMHGSQVVDFDGRVFGSFGTALGDADPEVEETGRAIAAARKLYLFDRYRNAAQTIRVNVRRSEVEDVRAGGWVVIDLSWIPDYVTQLRGGLFMGQVVAISDINCAWRELLVEQAVPVTDES